MTEKSFILVTKKLYLLHYYVFIIDFLNSNSKYISKFYSFLSPQIGTATNEGLRNIILKCFYKNKNLVTS